MNKYCININYTIKEAIERIDLNMNRMVVVLNDDSKICGVLTQGDIIRALSSGKNLFTRVDSIISSNFIYLNKRELDKAYILFKKNKITLIPIVDEEFHLLDVINMDDIFNFLEEKCNI